MKTILISGGLGSLSQNIIAMLQNQNVSFVIIDIVNQPKDFHTRFPDSFYIKADVSEGKLLSDKISAIVDKNNISIGGIVNTPAWSDFKKFNDTTFEAIEKTLNMKLLGYANVIKSSLPYLAKKSSIVNVSSVQAHSSGEGSVMYSAANGGVISLTKSLSVELRHRKIRVNTVVPGGFLTDIYKKTHDDWKEKIRKSQCLEIRDVSSVIVYLLGEESRGINGTEIIVDGGISAMRAKSSDY